MQFNDRLKFRIINTCFFNAQKICKFGNARDSSSHPCSGLTQTQGRPRLVAGDAATIRVGWESHIHRTCGSEGERAAHLHGKR